jgi:hypothetical protein
MKKHMHPNLNMGYLPLVESKGGNLNFINTAVSSSGNIPPVEFK